ncbi:MAG TPA: hypothetical protein VE650_13275 [Acetobacteraceae bacterium]|nr:hypothetical protein [Acetobacteraceae bacterium]
MDEGGAPGRVAAILLGGALLVWPAFYNGYPILFSDTGGLLEMGLAPNMGWDKPFVYGPLAALLSLHRTLWLPLAAQGVLASYVLWLTQAVFARPGPVRHVGVCAVLAAGTAAPWVTATLIPDFLAPVAALGLFVLGTGRLGRGHRVAAGVITTVAIAAHLSHLVLAAGCVVVLALLRLAVPWRPVACLAAALLFLAGSNWVGHERLAVSPHGSVFALARLVADGPARAHLDRVCPEAGYRLCDWRGRLTDDSDQFLWDPEGPFWSDPAPVGAFAAEASQIVRGTVAAYPLWVLADAGRNAARQLGRVRIGDTLVAANLDVAVRPRIARFFPEAELRRYAASAQVNGRLGVAEFVVALQSALLGVGAVGCALLLVAGLRRPSLQADFAAFVLIALAANALGTGALSTVHDRYQARIAWLMLVPPLVAAASRQICSNRRVT